MATKNGMNTRGGVRSTMNPPMGNKSLGRGPGVGGGMYGANKAPFDKAQDTGNGGISTKFFDGMPTKTATTSNAGSASLKKPGATQAVGTRRFSNPR